MNIHDFKESPFPRVRLVWRLEWQNVGSCIKKTYNQYGSLDQIQRSILLFHAKGARSEDDVTFLSSVLLVEYECTGIHSSSKNQG